VQPSIGDIIPVNIETNTPIAGPAYGITLSIPITVAMKHAFSIDIPKRRNTTAIAVAMMKLSVSNPVK
jgi:hypothetical protein